MNVETLGQVLKAGFGQAAAIRQENGVPTVCFIGNGMPAIFYEFELFSGKLLFSQPIPPTDTVWGLCRANEREVYWSGVEDGILYRYTSQGIEDLGTIPSNTWVFNLAHDEKRIWGGTYPNAKLFSYDRETSEFHDYGTIQQGEDYTRGIAIDGDWIFLGTGSEKHLIRFNYVTGERQEIMLQEHSGKQGFIDRLWLIDRYLFLSCDFIHMYVYDRETYTLIDSFDFDNLLLAHPSNPNLMLFKQGEALCGWDLNERRVVTLVGQGLPKGRHKAFECVQQDSEDYVAVVTVNAEVAIVKLSDLTVARSKLAIVDQPILLTDLSTSPTGKIFIGGYHRGMTMYDPETDTIDWTIGLFPQTEGMTFHGEDAYFGTYTHAHLYRYRMNEPLSFNWSPEGNPAWIGQVDYQQDRPFAMTASDRYVFAGTTPDYGLSGGALAIWDTQSETLESFHHVIPDQSIVGLAYWNGLLFGSSSVWGGLGKPPVEGPARIFVWDVEKKCKIADFVPDIPDLDHIPLMIGELQLGPDGLIWGAIDGTIFALDPRTYQVVKSRIVCPTEYKYSKWRPISLRWGSDGLLYTALARRITVIDPDTLAFRVLTEDIVGNITIDQRNRIYYSKGDTLYRITISDNLFK